jgi:hypothetical protein
MSEQEPEPSRGFNPYASKEDDSTTPGERIARYSFWVAFVVVPVILIWITKA